MATARLHDGSPLDVAVLGDGQAVLVLLPVSPPGSDSEAAEQMPRVPRSA